MSKWLISRKEWLSKNKTVLNAPMKDEQFFKAPGTPVSYGGAYKGDSGVEGEALGAGNGLTTTINPLLTGQNNPH